MCLSTVTWNAKSRKNPRKHIKWQVGYKAMTIRQQNPLIVDYIYQYETVPPALNTILKAQSFFSIDPVGLLTSEVYPQTKYHYGFHILETIQNAKAWARGYDNRGVFKVEYRGIVATGTQDHGHEYVPCIIAKEMRIIEQVIIDPVIPKEEGINV
jgi:hypothetical protein